MQKPKIIVDPSDVVVLNQWYLRPVFAEFFDIIDYVPGTTYNPHEHCVMTNSNFEKTWFQPLIDAGCRLIVDNLIEWQVSDQMAERYDGRAHVWSVKHYMWINEYYNWVMHGYQNYQPCKRYTHRALLNIRQLKPHRQQLLTVLEPVLDQLLYSVIDQGRFLPHDLPETDGQFQRYFAPEWYDSTYFTIVTETVTYSKYPVKVSEKSFKPIAFYHPFLMFGQTGTVAYLRELGFESFDNLFNESYDQQEDQPTRLAMILKNIQNFQEQDYDSLTWQKLQHNHELFFSADKIRQLLVNDVVNPLLEYVQTR